MACAMDRGGTTPYGARVTAGTSVTGPGRNAGFSSCRFRKGPFRLSERRVRFNSGTNGALRPIGKRAIGVPDVRRTRATVM